MGIRTILLIRPQWLSPNRRTMTSPCTPYASRVKCLTRRAPHRRVTSVQACPMQPNRPGLVGGPLIEHRRKINRDAAGPSGRAHGMRRRGALLNASSLGRSCSRRRWRRSPCRRRRTGRARSHNHLPPHLTLTLIPARSAPGASLSTAARPPWRLASNAVCCSLCSLRIVPSNASCFCDSPTSLMKQCKAGAFASTAVRGTNYEMWQCAACAGGARCEGCSAQR